ncbi:hypothetical protein K7432_011664 [Basidiobolus ranarum]|uniref:Uncharacterized protein n=1 Tax=Basidiobolus ranarum TaxID=34480 RepID=A0ABR2WM00_9FUNG
MASIHENRKSKYTVKSTGLLIDVEKREPQNLSDVILEKSSEEKPATPTVSLRELFNFATKFDWILMFVGLLAALISGAAVPLETVLLGHLINTFKEFGIKTASGVVTPEDVTNFRTEVNSCALYYVYLSIIILFTTYAYMSTWVYAGERQTRKIRESYLAAVLRQEIAWFDKFGAGEITTRITSDTNLIQDGISEKFPQSCTYLFTFISAFIIAFTCSWKLTLALSSIIPVMVTSATITNIFVSKYVQRALDHYSVSGTLAEEVISSIRTATAFGQQKKLSEMYNQNLELARKQGVKKALASGIGIGVIFFTLYNVYGLTFWLGGRLLNSNDANIGNIFNVLFAVVLGAVALGQITPNLQAFALAQGAAAKLYDVIYQISAIDSSSKEGIKPAEKTHGLIEFRDIHFTYPSRPNVSILKGVSITVKPGTTVALVGTSGSGKSTIIQLLERFYDPLEGEILLDGCPIQYLNVHWLRRQIGLVSQEPSLFKCTIAENIAHGLIGSPHENASMENKMELVQEACKIANAHDFIMLLPNKYDTHVGERGFLLSGGEKQRIAIARAIVKDPRILLLDEATSALDTQSESMVQQALDRASSGRTTIVIAHRLSTIRNADQIVVMECGQVVETGTHNSLLREKGFYYKLVELQNVGHQGEEPKVSPSTETVSIFRPKSHDFDSSQQINQPLITSVGSRNDIEEAFVPQYSFTYVFYRVFLLNKPELKFILGGLFGSIISGAAYPTFSIIFAEVVTMLSSENDSEIITRKTSFWALLLLGNSIVILIAYTTQGAFFGISGERLSERIRAMSFAKMLNQEIGWFDREENNTGALVSALSTDATQIQGVSGSTVGTILQAIVNIVGGIIVGLAYGWKFTVVVMGCIPLLIGTEMIHMKVIEGNQKKTKAAYAQSAQLACEAVSAIKTVASLTREQDVSREYHIALEEPVKAGKRNAFGSSFVFALSQTILFLINALGFWYGGRLLSTITYSGIATIPEYEAKQFYIVYLALISGSQNAGNIFSLIPDLSKAKHAASRIITLLDRQPIIDVANAQGDKVNSVAGHITFRNVHFRYPTRPEIPVLRGLDLDIKPGQFAALVGPSGCGKSTVISLTERFYDALTGSVMIDGQDVCHLNISDIRKNIALVGQEPTLYDMTIKENICFGLTERVPTKAEIEQAARDSNSHDFIMSLPLGYDTPLGGKGAQLSGGQKQRIAIARALIRQPKILLLDEATSALDATSESVVQAALDNASKGRTTIAVAHRLSTIRKADVIHVFKNGVVNEKGSHEELMALKGQYYSLVNQQNLSII